MAIADVRAVLLFLAPEFATTAVPTLDTAIVLAQDELDADRWSAAEVADGVTADAYYNRASALLAAHLLTLRGAAGTSTGPVQSERVGDVSVTYALDATNYAMDASGYGQQYQAFRRSIFPTATMVAPAEGTS